MTKSLTSSSISDSVLFNSLYMHIQHITKVNRMVNYSRRAKSSKDNSRQDSSLYTS